MKGLNQNVNTGSNCLFCNDTEKMLVFNLKCDDDLSNQGRASYDC